MKKLVLISFLILFSMAPLSAARAAATDTFPATVTDISDRAYEPAVIKLLDGAKESIVMSMYLVSLSSKGTSPSMLLLEDLIEARQRGVAVTIYLNTCFNSGSNVRASMAANPTIKRLQDAGCVIRLLGFKRRLHDKLIVVDSRYVVDGSTNWSLSALRVNYESATLIDSPGLAKMKLLRMSSFPDADVIAAKEKPEPRHESLYEQGLPASIEIPETLVTDRKYFANMVTWEAERVMDAYLAVLAFAEKTGKNEFFTDLESFGVTIGLSPESDDTTLRRQAIRSLRNLESRYGLVHCKFFHGKDAYITLTEIPGGRFSMPSDIVKPENLLTHSARIKFVRMITAYLKSRGEDINSFTDADLAKRFGVSRWTIGDARRDMERSAVGTVPGR